jgi:phosphoglycolate phosphatase-like HAD superfamily hydrolase
MLGVPVAECRVVVIGDTPKDIAAAKAIGAESIAVATGFFSSEALTACEPTRVFPDLAAPGALEVLLGH